MSDQKKIVDEERRLKIVEGLKKAIYPQTSDDLPDSLANTLKNVKDGDCNDKSYIRSNITLAARYMLDDRPLPDDLRNFIGEALLQIGFENIDANIALHLKIGHKPKANKIEESRFAMMVMWKVNAHNMPVQRAFEEVGKLVNKSDTTIKKIYYAHKEGIETELLG